MEPIKPLIIGNTEPNNKQAILVLITMFMAMVPLASHIPVWMSLLFIGMITWRGILIYLNKERPNATVISIIAIISAGIAGLTVLHELHPLYVIAVLMLLLGCKAMLARTPGAWTNISVMLPILPMAVFLNTTPSWGIGYMVGFTWLWIMASMCVWTTSNKKKYLFMQSFKIVILTLPFTVSAFLFMPKPDTWMSFLERQGGTTGISKKIKPGSMSKITDSKGTVFTAKLPLLKTSRDMYWRYYVMPRYDGEQWDATDDVSTPNLPFKLSGKPLYKYIVYLYDTGHDAKPALENTVKLPSYDGITRTSYGTMFGIPDTFFYTAEADFDAKLITRPTALDTLPGNPNWHPKTNEFVKELKNKSTDVNSFVDELEKWIRLKKFTYTKEPGKMTGDWLDVFLFERQKGFCEHYASAVSYMLRKAGYPARVVTGFQGGEYDYERKEYTIPYAAAHAWLEYWDESKGYWVRLDPTGWVAPERLTDLGWEVVNSREALQQLENSWWGKMFNTLASVEANWNKWVVNYDAKKQLQLLHELDNLPWFKILCIGLLLGSLLFIYKMRIHYRWSNNPKHLEYWLRHKFDGTSYAWSSVHTPTEWAASLKELGVDESAINKWVATYEDIVYGDVKHSDLRLCTNVLVKAISRRKSLKI